MNTNGTTPKFLPPHTPRVKADGDGLFRDQKYSEASVKYTGAINFANEESFDSKMKAVLYANRALCYKNMKRYVDYGLYHAPLSSHCVAQLFHGLCIDLPASWWILILSP